MLVLDCNFVLLHHNFLCKHQFGIVKGRHATDALIDFIMKAITALDEKFNAVGVFLDFAKAFDYHKITSG